MGKYIGHRFGTVYYDLFAKQNKHLNVLDKTVQK